MAVISGRPPGRSFRFFSLDDQRPKIKGFDGEFNKLLTLINLPPPPTGQLNEKTGPEEPLLIGWRAIKFIPLPVLLLLLDSLRSAVACRGGCVKVDDDNI